MFLLAQVDGAPACCLGGHRFESCLGRKFFCPMFMTCWLFRFHIGRACSTVTMDPLPVGGCGVGGGGEEDPFLRATSFFWISHNSKFLWQPWCCWFFVEMANKSSGVSFYRGTLLIRSPMGQKKKKWPYLRGGWIYQENVRRFLPGCQKSGHNNEVTVLPR